jgi:toxin CcdB
MNQFDVCELRRGVQSRPVALVAILQHSALDDIQTRVVAPLHETKRFRPVSRLHPTITLNGVAYVLAVEQLAAIDMSQIGPVRASVAHLRDQIVQALNLLFTGF